MTAYLIYLFFILISLGQLGRISLFSGSINLYVFEIVMFAQVLYFTIMERKSMGSRIAEVYKPFLMFLAALTLSFVVSTPFHPLASSLVALAYLVRIFLYFGFFVSLKCIKKEVIKKGLLIFAACTITFSYLQYFLVPSLKFLKPLGWDPHEFRVFGTFLDVTPAGVIFILLFLWLLIRRNKAAILLIPLILLTYSRITYLGFIFSLLFLLTKNIQKKMVLGILAFFIICIPFLPRPAGESTRLERTFSIDSRFVDMKKGVELWQNHVLIGVGYNQISEFKNSTKNPLDHSKGAYSSSYVTILATSGVVGLGAFLYLLWSLYKRSTVLGQVATGVVMVTSLFDNVLLTNFVLVLYLVLIALEDDL